MYLLFFAVLNYLSYRYSNVSIRKVVSTYKLGDIQAMPHPAVSPCAIEPEFAEVAVLQQARTK